MCNDAEQTRRSLRWMIAQRGINGLLEDVGDVCKDIAKEERNHRKAYAGIWMDRSKELKKLGEKYNIGRRADR